MCVISQGFYIIQGDQLNMAVFFCDFLYKSGLSNSSVREKAACPVYGKKQLVQCTGKSDLSSVLEKQIIFHKVPEKHGHVYLVTLYIELYRRIYEQYAGSRD